MMTAAPMGWGAFPEPTLSTGQAPVDQPPVAGISVPSGPFVDDDHDGVETVTLTSSATDDNGISSYDWRIDGSSVSSGPSLDYAFSVGSTTVELVVTDSSGQAASASAVVTVEAGQVIDLPPVAGIVVPQGPFVDEDLDGFVSIMLTSSATDDQAVVSQDWQVGGASIGTGASVTYAFPGGGHRRHLVGQRQLGAERQRSGRHHRHHRYPNAKRSD